MAVSVKKSVRQRQIDYAEIRQTLESLLAVLNEKQDLRRKSLREERQSVDFSQRDDLTGEDIGFALVSMATKQIHEVEEALLRLRSGVYGKCVSCKDMISTGRLRALPTTIKCRECVELGMTAKQKRFPRR